MISKNVSGEYKGKGDSCGSIKLDKIQNSRNKELSHFQLIKDVVHNADTLFSTHRVNLFFKFSAHEIVIKITMCWMTDDINRFPKSILDHIEHNL